MVEKIRELCKSNGISISRLEKETGLGNGIIGKWEKFGREPKFAHLKAIADYFHVPVSELTGEAKKESPPQGGEPMRPEWYAELTPGELEQVQRFAEFLIAERRKDQP